MSLLYKLEGTPLQETSHKADTASWTESNLRWKFN